MNERYNRGPNPVGWFIAAGVVGALGYIIIEHPDVLKFEAEPPTGEFDTDPSQEEGMTVLPDMPGVSINYVEA